MQLKRKSFATHKKVVVIVMAFKSNSSSSSSNQINGINKKKCVCPSSPNYNKMKKNIGEINLMRFDFGRHTQAHI